MSTLRPGDPAPDLELIGQSGQHVSLAALRGQGVIVYFFPQAFSPGCTTEVCDFRDHQESLSSAGYVVLGVSEDPPERLAEFATAHALGHELLSDPGCEAARRWGAYGEKSVNGVWSVGPIRSTFVVGPDGVLQSVQYHVTAQGHVGALQFSIQHAELG